MDKFGFYLILLICLGIIGVTAILTREAEKPAHHRRGAKPAKCPMEDEALDNASENDIDIIITDIRMRNLLRQYSRELEAGAKDTPKKTVRSRLPKLKMMQKIRKITQRHSKTEERMFPLRHGSVRFTD